jgi:DNA-binding NarL/FixJ family response regulator
MGRPTPRSANGCCPPLAEFTAKSRDIKTPASLDLLTPREREVVLLVASGLSNEQIASHLYLSPSTAKTHTTRAMTKLGARDRAQLMVYTYEGDLIRPGWTD